MNLWIRVAVSKVVAAKEMTNTAMIVLAIIGGIPKDLIKAPPPNTNAVALFVAA
jgi:hypothetical protein